MPEEKSILLIECQFGRIRMEIGVGKFSFAVIIGWWYIRQYTTKEKNATPFSFKGAAGRRSYRASDLVQ